MKNIVRKLAAVGLTAALACSVAGCNMSTGKWSYKTDSDTVTAGSWIYSTYQSYNEALSKLTEENSDLDTSTVDLSTQKIENKNAIDWIFDESKDKCVSLLTIEKLAKDKGVKVDEENFKASADMYSYYYSYSKEATAFYEELGVSEESYITSNLRYNYLYQELFLKLYGKDGEKAVADDEVKKYFKENYISYYYIPYYLQTTDEDGNKSDIDDETKESLTTNFNKYRNMINNDKKAISDVEEAYLADFGAESVPKTENRVTNTAFDESSDLSDELKEAIKKTDEGKASVTLVDDTLYFIYRDSLEELSKKLKYPDDIENEEESDDISNSSIIYEMKKDEYDEYIENEKKNLKYDTNDSCISKYTVQRTIDIVKSE